MIKRLLQLRIVLLVITGSIACWFISQAVKGSFTYIQLNTQTPAEHLKWEIKMLSASHYKLSANYRYSVDGQEFNGQTTFSSPAYLNYYAAENDLKTKQNNAYTVWFHAKDPTISSLQKRFPKKESTNALLTLGVFIYFYFVRGLLERVFD